MPTYTLLGATGATGAAILRFLLCTPPEDLTLKIYVRSRSKLFRLFPDLQANPPFPIHIVEGVISDKEALQSCLEGANVVFMCIATNESTPGTSISFDIAEAVVHALETVRQEKKAEYVTPTVLHLRAIPVNKDMQGHGGFIESIICFCLYHIYSDHERASALLETTVKETPGILEYIFVDPPALHDADGTERTGYRLATAEEAKAEPLQDILSYADLGEAFCEIAVRKEEFAGKGVLVAATGKVNLTWGANFGFLVRGAKGRVFG